MEEAVCSQCGGQIKVDEMDENGFCECLFCHTKVKVMDVVKVQGVKEAFESEENKQLTNLLNNAKLEIEDGNAEKAEKLYKQALAIKPDCHEAWWGRYLCNRWFDQYYGYKDKYGNYGLNVKKNIMKATLEKYALRAIECAPDDVKQRYQNEIQGELDFINSESEIQQQPSNPKSTKKTVIIILIVSVVLIILGMIGSNM